MPKDYHILQDEGRCLHHWSANCSQHAVMCSTLTVRLSQSVRYNYSSVTDEAVKNRVLSSFTDPNGLVRIVVATIAFGLGINAPDVRYIVNWGPVLKPTYKKQEEMAWMLKQHYTTIKLMLPWSQMT